MKGATAEPWVRKIRRPSKHKVTIGGPNHHFLRTFIKSHNSDIIENLLGIVPHPIYSIKRLTDSPW